MDVLILHGWGSSSKSWKQVKQLLENEGFSVFVPDLPGFGENALPDSPWSAKDYAQWLNQWTEEHQLSKFSLIGHSFGGAVAALFATKYSNKVERLILVAPAIIRQKKLKQRIFFFLSKIGGLIFSLSVLTIFRPLAQKLIYRLSGVQDYYKLILQDHPVLKETFKKIIREDLTQYLSNISIPTILIWGDRDYITPFSQAKIIAEKLSCPIKTIPGRGHALNLEAPEELAEEIVKFLHS